MEENNPLVPNTETSNFTRNSLSKLFDPATRKAIAAGAFAAIAILVLAGLIAWHNRANIFKYLASAYERQVASVSEHSPTGTPEKPADAIAALIAPAGSNTQPSIEDAVSKANPAVVAITISKTVPKYETSYQNISPFDGLTFQIPTQKQNGVEKQEVGAGSGFIITSNGIIVTNRHVVEDTDAEYTVVLSNGKKYTATVLARDPVLDVAFIQVTASGLPHLSLGDSDSLKLGQQVIAIGNALGQFQNTVSVGIVSGLSRSIMASGTAGAPEALDHVIQTDAAINPGNSGGPLLDTSGNVVGVNVAVALGSQSIGFALPINSIKSALTSVESTGKIIRPYLGIRYTQITPDVQEAKNLSVNYGALVAKGPNGEAAVLPGSPADTVGIKEGDIILSVSGVKLDSTHDLASIIRDKHIGDPVTLVYLRAGSQKSVTAYLQTAPQQ